MHKGIIGSLALSVLVVVFALQNIETVTLKLFFWEFQASLALLVVILIVLGALLIYLLLLPSIFRKNRAIKSREHEIKQLKSRLSANAPGERAEKSTTTSQ